MKKRICLLLLCLALCLYLCACANAPLEPEVTPGQTPSVAAPQDTVFSVYNDNGVTFQYPSDWQSVPSPIAGATTFAAPVERGVFAASVSIVKQDTGIALSFEQFKQFAAAQYNQMSASYTVSEVMLAGKNALYYVITLPAEYGNGTEIQMAQYVLQKDSAFYVLAMMEAADAFAARQELFTYIGQSFNVE